LFRRMTFLFPTALGSVSHMYTPLLLIEAGIIQKIVVPAEAGIH